MLVYATVAILIAMASWSSSSALTVMNQTNTGFPENGVFHGSDLDSIRVDNGNLHVHIPIWATKGRGLHTSASFVYDNKGWACSTTCINNPDGLQTCTAIQSRAQEDARGKGLGCGTQDSRVEEHDHVRRHRGTNDTHYQAHAKKRSVKTTETNEQLVSLICDWLMHGKSLGSPCPANRVCC